jgi:uncharacterized membrane protein
MMSAHNDHKPLGPGEGERVEYNLVIRQSPAQLYARWQDLEGLSRIFTHVDSVTQQADGPSHWVLRGPHDARYELDVEVVDQVEAEHIGWQSLPGGDVAAAGSVHFHPKSDSMTELRVLLRYDARGPGVQGDTGRATPAQWIAEDLERLKAHLETSPPAA